jgi:hypothetical protein
VHAPSNPGGGGFGGVGNTYNADVATLQSILNTIFGKNLNITGIYDSATIQAMGEVQLVLKQTVEPSLTLNGLYNAATRQAMSAYMLKKMIQLQKNQNGSSMIGQAIQAHKQAMLNLPTAFYAKGTLGTKRDEWAITDESWIGEEITLAAGKNGQLQYLKKGSAVIPADISANLVEWGKLDPRMLNMENPTSGINIISNAVNKPEFNLSFDALVKADRIDEGTLPEVKRFVQQEINSLVKQMNYSIKGYAR